MKALQETTVWDAPNHIYITNDSRDKLHAYVVGGELRTCARPLRFSTTRRKFTEIENVWLAEPEQSTEPSWQVVGSNGSIYTIKETDTGRTCTCSGFRFRGQCRHTKENPA